MSNVRKCGLIVVLLSMGMPFASSAEEGGEPAADATRGLDTFILICAHCHRTDYEESRVKAPGLRDVLERHDEAWLHQWLKNPAAFAKKDETAKTLIESNPYKLVMPTLPEMQDEQRRKDIIEYMKTLKGDE